ncbi:MAG: DUF2946 family protein [Burkholderiales bacterium]
MRRASSVFWSWMVAAALLVGIVSPAIGQSFDTPNSQAARADVCTSGGWIAGEPGDAPQLPAKTHLFGHCPICSAHGALPALSRSCDVAPSLALTFALPRVVLTAPPAARGWQPAQPRGPPRRG